MSRLISHTQQNVVSPAALRARLGGEFSHRDPTEARKAFSRFYMASFSGATATEMDAQASEALGVSMRTAMRIRLGTHSFSSDTGYFWLRDAMLAGMTADAIAESLYRGLRRI